MASRGAIEMNGIDIYVGTEKLATIAPGDRVDLGPTGVLVFFAGPDGDAERSRHEREIAENNRQREYGWNRGYEAGINEVKS